MTVSFKAKDGTIVPDSVIEEIADAFERGEWPGSETRILRGRPLKLGEQLQSVTYKDTVTRVSAMDRRAGDLGMSRSDYLRSLVGKDLAQAAST